MMKKLLSIILTVCMLFSLVIVPVSVNAVEPETAYEESTLGSYYKFTFKEGEMYNYAFGEPVTYKGDTFYPLSAAGSTGNSVGYKAVKDVDTKEVYDTLEVKTGSANIVFTPVTKEGQPFEMKPGVEYTVKVNMFNPASHTWAHSYITLGKNKSLFGTSSASGGTNQLEYKNGTFVGSQSPFMSGSIAVQGGQGFAFSFPEGTYGKSTILGDCVHPALEKEHGSACNSYNGYKTKKVFREINEKYTVDTEHFEYNAETNSYSADMKAYDFVRLYTQPEDWAENYASYYVFQSWKFQLNTSETFTAGSVFKKVYKQDVAVNNYLSLCLGGGNAHGDLSLPLFGTATKANVYDADGKVIPAYDTYQIESIEVCESIDVTCVYLDKSTENIDTAAGLNITYPTLAANTNYDHVWSLSATEYIPAPSKLYADTTVYEYNNDVLSFENMKLLGTATYDVQELNSEVSTKEAYTGSKSIRLRNNNVLKVGSKPTNWDTNYTDYFYLDSATGDVVQFAAQETVPNYSAQKVYSSNPTSSAVGRTYLHQFDSGVIDNSITDAYKYVTNLDFAYKVTFKYKTTEKNTASSKLQLELATIDNPWWGASSPKSTDVVEIAAGATDGWKTASITWMYKGAFRSKLSTGIGLNLYFVNDTVGRCTNEIFIDDVSIETVPVVTMVNYQGTTSTAMSDIGETIDYPTTPESYNDHYVWSLSKDEYIPAPLTVTGDVTVYQIKSDVNAFQNKAPYDDYLYKVGIPSVQFSDEGAGDHRSIRLKNYGVSGTAAAPSDWTTNPTKYGYYVPETDKYINLTKEEYDAAGGDFATLVAKHGGLYDLNRSGNNTEQANIPILQPTFSDKIVNANYKVTFKYKYKADPSKAGVNAYLFVGNHGNIWPNNYKAISNQKVFLPFEDTTEWHTATLYSVISGVNVNDTKPIIALKVEDAVAPANKYTFEILVDDVVIENFDNTPTVIFHDEGTVTEVTEGVTAGADYTPTLVGTNAPEGLKFKGWSTTADGLNIVSTVKMPAADVACKVQLYAVYGAIPKVIYHDNGVETEITEGLVAGSDYIIDRLGAGVEGKYFAGWATTENGTSYVTKVSITDVGEAKHHLYAVYKDYQDSFYVNYENYANPAVTGSPHIGYKQYETVGSGKQWVDYPNDYKAGLADGGYVHHSYTEDGLKLTKSRTSGQGYSFNPSNTANLAGWDGKAYTTAKGKNDPIDTVTSLGWGVYSSFVFKDAQGNALMAKPGTTYRATITYKVTEAGSATLGIIAGRKYQYRQTGANDYSLGSYVNKYATVSVNAPTKEVNGEYETVTVSITTPASFGTDIPALELYATISGITAKRVEKATIDGKEYESYTLDDGTEVYPYEVLGVPEVYVKDVQLVEVKSGYSAVTFNSYEKGVGYSAVLKLGKIGDPLDVETKSFDAKWYKDIAEIHAGNVVTTYPSSSTQYYDASYAQANISNATKNYYADRMHLGKNEILWDFENKKVEVDGETKYALHVAADEAITTGDSEMFILTPHIVPGNVYKLSYKYKANANNSKFGLMFATAAYHNIWPDREVCATSEVAASTANGEWVEQTVYFTAMTRYIIKDETETGIDYVNKDSGRDTLYVVYYQDANENGNDVEFIDFEVVDLGVAVEAKGASVLTTEAADAAGMQAMRFYFDYKTDDGSQIYLGNEEFKVVKRGFLYANGSADIGPGGNKGTKGDGVITSYVVDWIELGEAAFRNLTSSTVYFENSDKLNTCWNYDENTKMMRFSTYVTGFAKQNDTRKLEVMAYIVIEDSEGNQFKLFANKSINRSVAGVQGLGYGTDGDINLGQ